MKNILALSNHILHIYEYGKVNRSLIWLLSKQLLKNDLEGVLCTTNTIKNLMGDLPVKIDPLNKEHETILRTNSIIHIIKDYQSSPTENHRDDLCDRCKQPIDRTADNFGVCNGCGQNLCHKCVVEWDDEGYCNKCNNK